MVVEALGHFKDKKQQLWQSIVSSLSNTFTEPNTQSERKHLLKKTKTKQTNQPNKNH